MSEGPTVDGAGPLLILAPARRDAEAASVLLSRRGIACRILPDIAALGAAVDDHSAGAVLVADDALAGPALDTLRQALAAQPPWSDLPFVVLNRGATTRGGTAAAENRLFEALGNAVVLERPLHASTLTGAVRSALRARVRQRQWRALLAEREANAAALRESEERLRLIVEGAKDHAIITTDPEGSIMGWSPGAEAIFGWTAAEIVGGPSPVFFTPEDRAAGVPEQELGTAREAGCANDERWHLCKDGGRVFMNGSVHPLHDASGALRGFIKIARDETERRRAETELRRSQAEAERQRRLYEAILANTPDLAYVFDLDHRFTYANEGLLKTWGRTREEAIGKNCLELGYEPWHATMHGREIERVVATRQPIRGEAPFTGPLGRRIYEYIFVPVLGEGGEVEAIAGTTRDVTERKHAEEALKKIEARFRRTADTAPALLWVTDGENRCTYLSRSWYEFTVQTPETGLGFGWLDAIHPDDREMAGGTFLAAAARREPFRFEYRLRGADGEYRWGIDAGRPHFCERGEYLGYVGSVIDIQERKAAEGRLRESEARFRAIVEQVGAGIAQVDRQGRFLLVNDRFCELVGRPRERLLGGLRIQDITHPDDLAANLPAYGRAIHQGVSFVVEKRFLRSDGAEIWVNNSVAPVRDTEGRVAAVVAVAQDVTARRAAEEGLARYRAELERLVEERTAALLREAEERRRAEEAARQGEKLQAVGQLTGGIAHDFNNILQVVSSGAQLLKSPRLDERRRAVVLDGMVQAAQNAKELTGRLLAFARKQPLRPETFDLNARLLGMAELLRGTLGGRIRVATDLAPGLWPVRIDPYQLEVALVNLAVNARDAMPSEGGGTLVLRTRNLRLGNSPERPAGEYVCLAVKDTGRGMPPAVLARVFEPIFTTKVQGKGTGLGLAQVHGFAKQSGGDVTVESAPGEGTSVVLHLPRAAAAEVEAKAAGQPAEVGQLMERAAGRAVLVVEDNADVADFACTMLEGLGYATRRAGSAREALELLDAGETVDAVFSDVVMPGGMSGLDLAVALQRRLPRLAVVLATGYSDALAGWRGPMPAEVLSKPYRLEEVAAALERALARTAGAAPPAVVAAE